MRNILEQSDNEVSVIGTLSELEIKEGISKKGQNYVSLFAKVRVDQEINGCMVENEVPVQTFCMKLKKDNTENPMYKKIIDYREKFTSLVAAADNPSDASRVHIIGTLEENSYYRQDGSLKEDFRINAKWINAANKDEKDEATFMIMGVIGSIQDEEKNDELTGRSKIKVITVGYNKKANVINMIAEGSVKAHIDTNWSVYDTIIACGRFNISKTTEIINRDLGFGELVKKSNTISVRDVVITGGSPTGLEDAFSYDADDIKAILADRKARLEQEKQDRANQNNSVKAKVNNFGF